MCLSPFFRDMRTALFTSALVTTLLTGGCRLFNDEAVVQGRSPLRPLPASPESVALEIVWARFPLDDPQLTDAIWSEIDETQLAPAVRRELAQNGFRAGVIAGTPPDAIVRALDYDAYCERNDTETTNGFVQSMDLVEEPKVRRRLLQLRRGRRAEIQASQVIESMPLLVSRGRELGGRTYHHAQTIYALSIDPQPDQTVAVELTPELHHGQPRVRWTGGEDGLGPLRMAPMRDREVFDAMRMNVRLAPGEMLLLMSLPDAGSRLGHYFHTTDSAAGPQQKLVLVRLAQVPASDTFDTPASF
jgi:hypothetical protein